MRKPARRASRALGEKGRGKYLVVYDLEDAAAVCDYILGKGSREAFMKRFEGCCSPGFDPDRDLEEVGIANQTTMLKTETQTLQKMIRDAIVQRDGDDDQLLCVRHHLRRYPGPSGRAVRSLEKPLGRDVCGGRLQ